MTRYRTNLTQLNNFFGLVLTGGESTRMKTDKAGLQYEGEPQARRCFKLLEPYCEKVFISTKKAKSSLPYQNDLPQIHDHQEFLDVGPLGGILSAMKEHKSHPWIILACDLPFVDNRTIIHLISNRDSDKFATAYRSVVDGLPEPLCSIYEPKYYPRLFDSFQKDIKCPRKIMINSDVRLLSQFTDGALTNVNTPEEYHKVQKSFGRK